MLLVLGGFTACPSMVEETRDRFSKCFEPLRSSGGWNRSWGEIWGRHSASKVSCWLKESHWLFGRGEHHNKNSWKAIRLEIL